MTSDLLFYYSIHVKTENVHTKCTFFQNNHRKKRDRSRQQDTCEDASGMDAQTAGREIVIRLLESADRRYGNVAFRDACSQQLKAVALR